MKHSHLLISLLLLSILPLKVEAAKRKTPVKPTEIILRAFSGDQEQWKLELVFKGKSGCMVGGQSIPPEECEEFQMLVKKMENEKYLEPTRGVQLADEPEYEILINKDSYKVALQIPEVCDILENGEKLCTQRRLSSAQKVLLKLRAFQP